MQKMMLLLLLLTGIAGSFYKGLYQLRSNRLDTRPTIDSITRQQGIITMVGDPDSLIYVIYYSRASKPLYCPGLPVGYWQDGLPVNFSGQLKSTFPGEEHHGQLFELTHITSLK